MDEFPTVRGARASITSSTDQEMGDRMIGEEQPQVAATHRSRPWWRRPRLGIGVLLVAGSVAVGTWAVRSAAAGEPAWVAVRDLAPGAAVSAQDLREVTLRWDGASGTYLAPADLTADSVVTSFVGEGELVPTSALGTTGDVAGRPMAVAVPVGGSPGRAAWSTSGSCPQRDRWNRPRRSRPTWRSSRSPLPAGCWDPPPGRWRPCSFPRSPWPTCSVRRRDAVRSRSWSTRVVDHG